MHFGTNNNRSRNTMLDHSDDYVQVSSVIEEKDLGVTFEPNLKFYKGNAKHGVSPRLKI